MSPATIRQAWLMRNHTSNGSSAGVDTLWRTLSKAKAMAPHEISPKEATTGSLAIGANAISFLAFLTGFFAFLRTLAFFAFFAGFAFFAAFLLAFAAFFAFAAAAFFCFGSLLCFHPH